ncbi:hypothetical protein [Streptomyces sp. TLI_171]|uniref:hypothetical protein n=1 Tax=Streptomyces sp. TLI_171 TaxID=1938859 RepID=UPI0015D52BD7|nr:hypothetical protein [Streptomyces sp. TLI_171]
MLGAPPGQTVAGTSDDAFVVPFYEEAARFTGTVRALVALLDQSAPAPAPSGAAE